MAMVHQQRKICTSTYGTEFKYLLELLYSVPIFSSFKAVVDSADYRPSNDWKKAGNRASPCKTQDKIELLAQGLHGSLEN
jgi:hypothetical protein